MKFIITKKIKLYLLGLCCIIIATPIIRWAFLYFYDGVAGLKPELLFELPVDECGTISFTTNEMNKTWVTVSLEVNKICRSRVFKNERRFGKYDSFFVVKGSKAVRFLPERFHGVKGDIEFESADLDTAYFYRYCARYYPIVLQP